MKHNCFVKNQKQREVYKYFPHVVLFKVVELT